MLGTRGAVHPPSQLLSWATLWLLAAACSRGSSRPSIQRLSVPESASGEVAVQVTLADPASQPLDVTLEVSRDQLAWNSATTAQGTTLTGLATSPEGTPHVFTWDSLADLGFRVEGDTWIKITATGAGGLVDIQTAKVKRIDNLLPASKRVRHHLIHFGPLDEATVRVAETHDLVILYPCQPTVTRALIADIQDGVDPRDPRDDCIVLGYVDVGEDERTIGLSDGELHADPRFVGDGSGPRVDPRGPNAGGRSLAGIDLRGLPSVSGGYASFYLDDNSVETHGIGDGLPDRNGVTGACYVNAGDPIWFDTLHEMLCSEQGFAGIRETLSGDYGAALACDGVFLDNIDTCAPNSFTEPGDPDHATFEWTAPGVTDFVGELRRRWPSKVIMQNRGLFFFDPRYPQYHFTTGPLIDFLKIESYRLDRETSREFDTYAFAENKHNLVPRLQAEAQRFTFQVLSLGYAEGPGISHDTLLGRSNDGFDTLLADVREAEQVGFRHYLTSAAGDLVNEFARQHGTTVDVDPPVWSSTYNAFGSTNPPGAPVPRVGIQQVEVAPGSLTVRWDVAIDQNPVTYHLFYGTKPIRFDRDGFPAGTSHQELYPARVSPTYADGPAPDAYPFEATSTGLLHNTTYYFCIFARDSAGNWAKDRVVLSARTR
ncbi:MAG: fibronectin type III domain-containing protein [Planctomycetota bacterium]